MTDSRPAYDRLTSVLEEIGPLAIAVSGGVDSMTLAHVAHRRDADVEIFHALSPAVPAEATQRVRDHAQVAGWTLALINAHEMQDPRYLENPANRCFFCKTNLYTRIRAHTGRTIVSGTNSDDLGDYRPGLQAARDHGVRHPYVEAGIDKGTLRAIAQSLGLGDIAALPAAPCLSSRIETGIAVTAQRLGFIEAVERVLRQRFAGATARCRLRRGGVVIELDPAAMAGLDSDLKVELTAMARTEGYGEAVRIEPYRRGSAFLRAAK